MTYDEKDFVLNKQKGVVVYIKNKKYTMTVNHKPITIMPEVERFLVNYDLMTSLLIYGIPEKKMLLEKIVPYPDEGWDKKFYNRFVELHPRMKMSIWYETDEYKPQAKNGQYDFLVFTLKNCYTWYVTTKEERKLVNILKRPEQTLDEIQADVLDFFELLYPKRLEELSIAEEDDEGYDEYNSYKKLTFRRVAYSFLTSKGFPIEHEPIPQKPEDIKPVYKQRWYEKVVSYVFKGTVLTAASPFFIFCGAAITMCLVMMILLGIALIGYCWMLLLHIIT